MFCVKCGNKVLEGAQFCSKCGAAASGIGQGSQAATPVQSNPSVSVSSTQGKGKLIKIAGIAVAIIIAIVIIVNISGGNQYVDAVRNGNFEAYPNIAVGRAFSNVYSNTNWSHFENARGENIVRFSGRWQSSTYEWDFRVDSNTFEVVAIRENGIEQSLLLLPLWLEIVFASQ